MNLSELSFGTMAANASEWARGFRISDCGLRIRKSGSAIGIAVLLIAGAMAGAAEPEILNVAVGELQTEPSFEACSYYFRPPAGAAAGLVVEFRRTGEGAWQRAFDPVSDLPAGIWKGSLFNLTEDTAWEVRVRDTAGQEVLRPVAFRTWSSHPPIARVVDLSKLTAGPEGLVISDRGRPDGWIKFTAPAGWRLERPYDANDRAVAAITFRQARHVILENVTIVGGARNGILVEDSDSVRILNCELTDWGRPGVQQFTNDGARGKYADIRGELINFDGGVHINRSARTVVERCYVHDPRHRANSWMYSHPAGPGAMFVNHALGGTVVRWNDFVGSDEHRWNDVIESSRNSAANGGFFRDSDITGNFLAFGNDDGVELEGGGMNVRFYRNKIEGTTCSISTGACILGPQFVFENLVANPGDEAGLALWFLKNSHGAEQGGRRHFINNTLVGPQPGAYGGYGKPIGTGRIGFMRNNLFVCSAARRVGDQVRRDDFDGDQFWTAAQPDAAGDFLETFRRLGQEAHGTAAAPRFVDAARGDFHLAADSPARGRALPVVNLTPAGADLGAFASDATEVPFRPLALSATPRQLDFSAPRTTASMPVTLSVPRGATAPVQFEIRQNRVFNWFKVTPAAGTVAPGSTLTLHVTVDPASLRGRPRFRGAFLIRTPSGLSRPVSVYATPDFTEDLRPASAPNTVYLEAAGLAGTAGSTRPDPASNIAGGRIVALAARENAAPELRAKFTIARPGSYSLLMRAAINGDPGPNRTLMIGLDGGAAQRVPISVDYEWNTGATNFRAVYLRALGPLAAGEHELRVTLASGELRLNELMITDHPAAFFIDTWQQERN